MRQSVMERNCLGLFPAIWHRLLCGFYLGSGIFYGLVCGFYQTSSASRIKARNSLCSFHTVSLIHYGHVCGFVQAGYSPYHTSNTFVVLFLFIPKHTTDSLVVFNTGDLPDPNPVKTSCFGPCKQLQYDKNKKRKIDTSLCFCISKADYQYRYIK